MVLISSSSTFIHLASSASCMASLAQKFIQPLYLTWDPFLNIQLPPQPFHLNYGVTSQVLSWSLLSAQQWANPFQIYSYNNMALLETLQWLPTWAARILSESHCCCYVASNSLRPHGPQHTRLLCPPLCPGVCSNACPLSRWCHPTISSSVISCLQCFPASGSFSVGQFFISGGQSIGASASASVLALNIQGRFSLGLTGLISLLSKGLSRVFSSTTVQKHQFSGAQPSLWSSSHIHTWLLETL